jgi:hypothetical protein
MPSLGCYRRPRSSHEHRGGVVLENKNSIAICPSRSSPLFEIADHRTQEKRGFSPGDGAMIERQ